MTDDNLQRLSKLLLSICLFQIFFCASAQAEFWVEPAVTQVMAKQGETKEVSLLVSNKSDAAMSVSVEAENWHVRYAGFPGTLDDVYAWMVFDTKVFEIPAHSDGDYTFNVTVPKDLKDEAMAQVYFTFSAEKPDESTAAEPAVAPTMQIEQRLGVLVSIAAEETAALEASIKDIQIMPYRKEDGTLNLNFRVYMENTGNVHANPSGVLKVCQGDICFHEARIGKSRAMFRGKSGTYETRVEDAKLAPGTYKLKALIAVRSYELWKNLEFEKEFTIEEMKPAAAPAVDSEEKNKP